MNKLELTRFPQTDYAFKESINTLCTNLTFAGEEKRIIEVTSCQAHEGKSFMSLCMQRNLARLGHTTALVDMDLRKSQFKSRYGMEFIEGNGHGVTHYLAGMCSLNDVVYETDVQNAYMIPVGQTVSNSLALLSTSRLSRMLKELREKFDFVIVDAPPVGVIIDAAEIAKSCNATIFVVKYNTIGRRELAEAKEQILRSGCDVLGAVLNDVAFDTLSSKKYYNKSYYSYYDSDYYKPSSSGRQGSHRESKAK